MSGKEWTGDGWRIIHGRWQDSPLDSCDHVISDPPYDARTHAGSMKGARHGGVDFQAGRVLRTVCESREIDFDPIKPSSMAPQLILIARRWVVCFCSVEQLGAYQDACGDEYIRGGIWSKPDPTPQFSGDRPGVWGDGIAIMHRKGRKRWNNGGHCARWSRPTEAHFSAKEMRVHVTQKPITLMIDLIEAFTDPGELVWDPYAGSATTGVACLRAPSGPRRFVGHEMQEHYAEVAAERLAAEGRGLTLAQARAGQRSIFDAIGGDQ